MVRTFSQAALPLVLLLSVSYVQASEEQPKPEKQPSLTVLTASDSEPNTPKSSTSSAANASAAPAKTVTTPTAVDHANTLYAEATGRPTQLSPTPATASSSSSSASSSSSSSSNSYARGSRVPTSQSTMNNSLDGDKDTYTPDSIANYFRHNSDEKPAAVIQTLALQMANRSRPLSPSSRSALANSCETICKILETSTPLSSSSSSLSLQQSYQGGQEDYVERRTPSASSSASTSAHKSLPSAKASASKTSGMFSSVTDFLSASATTVTNALAKAGGKKTVRKTSSLSPEQE